MFKSFIILVASTICFVACTKEVSSEENEKPEFGFVQYTVPGGEHYSTDSLKFVYLSGITELNFKFKFDSTAIYTTVDPINQDDNNKLYGFADGVSFTTIPNLSTIPPHHINSARMGWHWNLNKKALYISAVYYNDSAQLFRDLQTVSIGKTYTARIKILQGGYEYTIDDKKDTVTRTCQLPSIVGYKLFPFFGGTEPAPHTVHVFVKDL
jgi:hypothetical protein